MMAYSKVVFFKAGSWSGVIRLAGDAARPSMARSSSASCLEMPLARQTTPDHLPTCITFLTGSEKQNQEPESECFFLSFDLFFCFCSYSNSEKHDTAWRVGCSGWPCGGISRHDAEDKRARDGLEASPERLTRASNPPFSAPYFERHPLMVIL